MRVGVVGYGYWGSKHVRVLSGIPGLAVSVIEPDLARCELARLSFPSVTTFTDYGHALDVIDAVIVATPPATHAHIARGALLEGKHVLVEKPIATTSADAQELVELAIARDLVLMAGHTFEHNPAVWRLKEAIDSGELGDVFYIDSARRNLGLYQSDVSVVWDLAPHDISITNYLLDAMPTSVAAWGEDHARTGRIDVASLKLDYATRGVTAYIHVSWLDPSKVRRVTVVGSSKMAVYDDMLPDERIRIYDRGIDLEDAEHIHEFPLNYRNGDIVTPYLQFEEPLQIEDRHFIDCIRNGERSVTPGESGLAVVKVLEAADRSLDLGRSVDIHSPASEPSLAIGG